MRSDTKDVADSLHGPGGRFALAGMTDDEREAVESGTLLSDSQMRETSQATTCERQQLHSLIAPSLWLLWVHAGASANVNEKKMQIVRLSIY